METFRDYLDSLCVASGVQYAELARRVGVTKSYIGQLVHGHSKPPPPERCRQLAEALDLLPAQRRRLLDLALRERARGEARSRIEELESSLTALRSTATDVLIGLVREVASSGEPTPEALADGMEDDEVLADLWRAATSGRAEPPSQLTERLSQAPPERLAATLAFVAAAVEGEGRTLAAAGAVRPARDVPLIGYVAAGETDIAFTDAGLAAGASLPGEEPVPRWHGLGQHTYALRIRGESMLPLCPPGTTIVIDPDRTPGNGEPGTRRTSSSSTSSPGTPCGWCRRTRLPPPTWSSSAATCAASRRSSPRSTPDV